MPPSSPTFLDLLQESGPFWGYTILLTLAAIIFAVRIMTKGWGIGYRLSLIPISFIPLLAGIGSIGWCMVHNLKRTASYGNIVTYDGVLSAFGGVPSIIEIIAFNSAQTLILLLLTAWSLLKSGNNPPATERNW